MSLTLEDTRKIHLKNLLLLDPPIDRDPVDIVKKLGYVQLDTVYVIARSHDIVFHSRSTSYKEEDVWQHHENNELLEEFAHARSLITMDEFRYYYTKMLLRRSNEPKWFQRVDNPQKLIKDTLEMIKENGEITTSDVKIDTDFSTRWSGLNRRVVDYLCLRGYTHVSRREGFSTIYYDLLENVIPDIPDTDELPDRMEVFWHDIYQTLDNHGIIPLHRLLHYTYSQRRFEYNGEKQYPRKLIKAAIKDGKIKEHDVEGTNTKYYSKPGDLDDINIPEIEEPQVFLLSPFDNLMWSREALEDQYNFYYKFEGYTPKKDRIYGYYCLPILFGTDIVGRVDPKLHRKDELMEFKQWTWEDNFKPSELFWTQLASSISRFVNFHQATKIDYGDLGTKFKEKLKNQVSL